MATYLVVASLCIALFIILTAMSWRTLIKPRSHYGKLIYLACPYTHEDPEVRRKRYEQSLMATIHLIRLGYNVFAPLIYTVPLESRVDGTYEKWLKFNLAILSRCDELWVLKIPGWEVSKSISEDIACAKEHYIPVRYVDYEQVVNKDKRG